MNKIGWAYYSEKKQYDKTLARFILAAMENSPAAQNNIGALYENGEGVPRNFLCTLKWYLKAVEGNIFVDHSSNIGWFFENGQCVPLDKYKALEWYCRGGNKTHINRLKGEGYYRSTTDKSKLNYIIIPWY
jgi:TPR repeat protein